MIHTHLEFRRAEWSGTSIPQKILIYSKYNVRNVICTDLNTLKTILLENLKSKIYVVVQKCKKNEIVSQQRLTGLVLSAGGGFRYGVAPNK